MHPTKKPSRGRLIAVVASITTYALIGAAGLLTIAATADLAGPSEATPLPSHQRVDYGQAAISTLSHSTMDKVTYPWKEDLAGWTIEFVEGESEIAGYTWSHEQRIQIFVRDNSTVDSLYRVLAHEFGHAVDVSLNSGDERRQWLTQRGQPNLQWWPDSGKADFQTGAGDFAEVFAVWMIKDSSDFRSQVGPTPSPADLELMEELVNSGS